MSATRVAVKSALPPRLLLVVLLVIAAICAWRTMPLAAANADDHVRLYFGGYVGLVGLGGGERAAELREELRAATARISDPYLVSRFVAAQSPYSPLMIAVAAAAEPLRRLLPAVRTVPWILGVQTVLWLVVLAVALRARARLPACSPAWFLAAALTLSWIHGHTNPFLPVPRAFACLFTGLGLAFAATGASERWVSACALAAAASHPYNQAINLAVAVPAAALLGGTAAAPGLRLRSGLRLAAFAAAGVAAGALVVSLAHPAGDLDIGSILGERAAFDAAASWSDARPVALRLTVGVGLPLAVLVARYSGVARALAVGALFVATVGAAALLAPSGYYSAEYVRRLGGGWVAVLFGLCLRHDLLPAPAAGPRWRNGLGLAAVAVVAAPAAFPEWTGVPHTIHRPVTGRPAGLGLTVGDLSPVEAECLRILREARPPRRGRGAGDAQGDAIPGAVRKTHT